MNFNISAQAISENFDNATCHIRIYTPNFTFYEHLEIVELAFPTVEKMC